MRLIDANALKANFVVSGEFAKDLWHAGTIRGAIDNAPTVEAVEVVHGHWFNLDECANAGVYCSVCHKKVYKEDYAWCNRKNKLRSNFCPNCGADMRERKDKE